MKLKIDNLCAEEFGRLNDYVRRESNIERNDSGSSEGLKVVIEGIEKAGPFWGTDQNYEGIKILVEDFALTKKELYDLIDIVYSYKNSE